MGDLSAAGVAAGSLFADDGESHVRMLMRWLG